MQKHWQHLLNHLWDVWRVAEHTITFSLRAFAVRSCRWWISCGIEFLSVLRGKSWRRQRWGSDSLAVPGSCLFLANSLHFMGPVWCIGRQKQQSCQVALQDPTKLSLSSTFPSAMKKRYEQMDEVTCSIPLWWICGALLPLYVCFPCFNSFGSQIGNSVFESWFWQSLSNSSYISSIDMFIYPHKILSSNYCSW